jgi:hypothetical protein
MRKVVALLLMFFTLPAFAGSSLKCELESVYTLDRMSSGHPVDTSKLILGKSETVPAALTGSCPAVIGYPESNESTYVFYFARAIKQEDGSTTCSYTQVKSGDSVSSLTCNVK